MNSILVTGAAGFIGNRLAAHFESAGVRVVRDAGRTAMAGGRACIDASSLERATEGTPPEVILHAAGSGTVSQVVSDPSRHMSANLAATLGVLEYARTCAPRAHVVLLSSAAVYGNARAEPLREGDSREPVSLYGLSKAQSEQVLAHYSRDFGLRTTSVRLFSVYGPGLRKQLLWDAMSKYSQGQRDFFGTGQERRDWVHVDDVCCFMESLLTTPGNSGTAVFNCGGHAASTLEVLSHLAARAGSEAPRFSGRARAGDPVSLLADCSRAAAELGWKAQIGWKEGMSQYADWYAAERNADTLAIGVDAGLLR